MCPKHTTICHTGESLGNWTCRVLKTHVWDTGLVIAQTWFRCDGTVPEIWVTKFSRNQYIHCTYMVGLNKNKSNLECSIPYYIHTQSIYRLFLCGWTESSFIQRWAAKNLTSLFFQSVDPLFYSTALTLMSGASVSDFEPSSLATRLINIEQDKLSFD